MKFISRSLLVALALAASGEARAEEKGAEAPSRSVEVLALDRSEDIVAIHGKSLTITARLRVEGYAGQTLETRFVPLDADDKPIEDPDHWYDDGDGNIAVIDFIKPREGEVELEKTIYLPIDQLHLAPGPKHEVRLRLEVRTPESTELLARSDLLTVDVDLSEWRNAVIKLPSYKWNHIERSAICGRARLELRLEGVEGHTVAVSWWFLDKDGKSLTDTDQSYYATDGSVTSFKTIEVDSDRMVLENFELTIPLLELHLPGGENHEFQHYISVMDMETGEFLARSFATTAYWDRR